MSFSGDLSHIAIVDVIQLLHSTRKSGTLCVKKGRKLCRIVFNDGYMVSASHPDNSVQIGRILVDMGVVGQDVVDKMLADQESAGESRKPLISMMLDGSLISGEDGLKGLEKLIQMTVVELIGWQKGTFQLDVESKEMLDQYRYLADKTSSEVTLDSQMVLMDALRIFDELVRDGKIDLEEDDSDDEPAGEEAGAPDDSDMELSADILGLSDVDKIEKEIPQFYKALEPFDPSAIHREKIKELLPGLDESARNEMASFLVKGGDRDDVLSSRSAGGALAAIIYSGDELLKYAAMNTFKGEGLMVMMAEGASDIMTRFDQCISKGLSVALVFDRPCGADDYSAEAIDAVRMKVLEKSPDANIIQLCTPDDFSGAVKLLGQSVRAVFPRPEGSLVAEMLVFLRSMKSYLRSMQRASVAVDSDVIARERTSIAKLRDLADSSEVFSSLLTMLSSSFERVITFTVRDTLVGVRGLGLEGDKGSGPKSIANLSVPLDASPMLKRLLGKGDVFYGEAADDLLKKKIFDTIGKPVAPATLFMPIKIQGKVKTLIYADFGSLSARQVMPSHFEMLANYAGLVLENDLYKKHIKKTSSGA